MRASWRENEGRMDEGTIDCRGVVDEVVGELVGDGVVDEVVGALVGDGGELERNGRRLWCFFVALVNRRNDFVIGNLA